MAAAGILALTEMTKRLEEDHSNAKYMAQRLAQIPGCAVNVDAVDINMVFFTLDRPAEQIAALPQRMLERGVKINGFTGNEGRFLTHYGLSRADIDQALDIFCECID